LKVKKEKIGKTEQVIIHKYPSIIEWLIELFQYFKEKLSLISESRGILAACSCMLVILIFVYYPSRVEDYDIFYHLKFGEHFVNNKTFQLDHSMFSWTPADSSWRYGIWLGSSALYLAYHWFSAAGLYVIQWLIFIAIAFLYCRFIKILGDKFDMSDILSLSLVYIALNLTAIYIKPELFTTLFFTIAVFIYFYTKHTKKSLFLIYPVLLLLWVNTHGGYLTGLAFISIGLVGEAVNYFFIKKNELPPRLLLHLLIAVIASYIAVLFNPYGIDYHIGIIKSLITEEYMGFASQVYAWVSMWKYLFPKDDFAYRFVNTAWLLIFMILSFVGLSIYAFAKKRYLDIAVILLNLFFFYEGMKAARVTIFLPLLWMFSMIYIFKKSDFMSIKKSFAPISLIVFIVLFVYIFQISLITIEDRSWFGSNLVKYSPVKEVEYVKKYKLTGPIFNDYLVGGYLIWALYPDYKVFIDPRYGPYWKEVGPDYFKFMQDITPEHYKKFIEKYPFKLCILSIHEKNLIFFLLGTGDWRILFFDKVAVILIHQSAIASLSKEALAVDMSTRRFRDVDNPLILRELFNFYMQLGPVYAKEIVQIYKQNVSSLYINKEPFLQEMQNLIAQRERQLGIGVR